MSKKENFYIIEHDKIKGQYLYDAYIEDGIVIRTWTHDKEDAIHFDNIQQINNFFENIEIDNKNYKAVKI